jgi:hypothetical protein
MGDGRGAQGDGREAMRNGCVGCFGCGAGMGDWGGVDGECNMTWVRCRRARAHLYLGVGTSLGLPMGAGMAVGTGMGEGSWCCRRG